MLDELCDLRPSDRNTYRLLSITLVTLHKYSPTLTILEMGRAYF
jgi:hypothetical protein